MLWAAYYGYNDIVEILLSKNEGKKEECYFCKITSEDIIGPFEITSIGRIKNFNPITTPKKTNNDNAFFHYKCLVNSDYTSFKNDLEIDYNKTIKNVLNTKERCFRCGLSYPTIKCKNSRCDKWFHGHLCSYWCLDDSSFHCFDCLEDSFTIQNNKTKKQLGRDYFLSTNFSFYCFYPQVNCSYYFIPQSYEDYLKSFYSRVKNNSNNLFAWKSIIQNYNTVLLELVDMEYCFSKDLNLENGIYIRLRLKIKDLNTSFNSSTTGSINNIDLIGTRRKKEKNDKGSDLNEIELLYFAPNCNPDFLINKQLYEANLKLKSIISAQDKQKPVEVFLENCAYSSELTDISPKENSPCLKESDFERIEVIVNWTNNNRRSGSKDNGQKEKMRISFWDLYNKNIENKSFKSLMIKKEIEKIINDSNNEVFIDLPNNQIIKNYFEIVPVPMCFNLIKNRLDNGFYQTAESFLFDCKLIWKNSCIYNGEGNDFSILALSLFEHLHSSVLKEHKIKDLIPFSKVVDIDLTGNILGRKRKELAADNNNKNSSTNVKNIINDSSEESSIELDEKRRTRKTVNISHTNTNGSSSNKHTRKNFI